MRLKGDSPTRENQWGTVFLEAPRGDRRIFQFPGNSVNHLNLSLCGQPSYLGQVAPFTPFEHLFSTRNFRFPVSVLGWSTKSGPHTAGSLNGRRVKCPACPCDGPRRAPLAAHVETTPPVPPHGRRRAPRTSRERRWKPCLLRGGPSRHLTAFWVAVFLTTSSLTRTDQTEKKKQPNPFSFFKTKQNTTQQKCIM